VGIEFAVHLISPADSIALVSSLPPKMQLGGRVLWPRCGQLPRARERERQHVAAKTYLEIVAGVRFELTTFGL